MTTYGKEWLRARAREGNPSADMYNLDEVYPGERADLVRELKAALDGCDDPEQDRLGRAMLAAVSLNALPVLRSVVAVWREAYLGLLGQIEAEQRPSIELLAPEEQARLLAFKQRFVERRDNIER